MTSRFGKKTALLIGLALVIGTAIFVWFRGNLQTTKMHDGIAIVTELARRYGIVISTNATLVASHESKTRWTMDGNNSRNRYYKFKLSLEDLAAARESIVNVYGGVLVGELLQPSEAKLGWWTNTRYDQCVSRRIQKDSPRCTLNIYLLTSETNGFALIEDVRF